MFSKLAQSSIKAMS
ncbi:hypothetical protein [Escherichia coli]|nr:hypothetical protein [Escherichia coli]